ncbi:MAG: tetratricopeptide repeat protein [Planctomycetaceae bacterium]
MTEPSQSSRVPRGPIASLILLVVAPWLAGCEDDTATVRKIQAQRRARQQSETKVDHLGEAMSLVSRLVELDPTTAGRQIVYHLNAWNNAQASQGDGDRAAAEFRPTELLRSVSEVIPYEEAVLTVSQDEFIPLDVYHLRYCYLLRQVSNWVREQSPADPIWEKWLAETQGTLGAENAESLMAATKLFDWVVRNISPEPLVLTDPGPPAPSLPLGMTFRGAGYRQTPYQTLFRGTGDAWQRSSTFISLCRQASLSACMLGIADGAGNLRPWLVGVMIGEELYLFDCGLGIAVPGPDQVGIATLAQARLDASILRRMNVPGWFEYPVQKDDVQQCAAMLVLEPEAVSLRCKRLQEALTGDRRLTLYEDADAVAAAFEALPGIASARIWDVPLLARVYDVALRKVSDENPMIAFFTLSPWIILEGPFDQAKQLSLGRWRHLQGRFDDDEVNAIKGAKPLYLNQRQPEFEIADLRIDVELQKQYGIRRELGVTPEVYDRQIEQVQSIMRQGKNTASFWLSLIQYETNRFDQAESWFDDRVLGDSQVSRWQQAARYNLARSYEQLGESDKAIALYKTEGDVQEHGNRIRARLLARAAGSAEPDDSPASDAQSGDTPPSDTQPGETQPSDAQADQAASEATAQ